MGRRTLPRAEYLYAAAKGVGRTKRQSWICQHQYAPFARRSHVDDADGFLQKRVDMLLFPNVGLSQRAGLLHGRALSTDELPQRLSVFFFQASVIILVRLFHRSPTS